MVNVFSSPSTTGQRLLGVVRGIWLSTVITVFFALINIFQVSSLVLWPINYRFFKKCNYFAAAAWWSLFVFIMERIYRVEVVFTGDKVPDRENAILVCNHQTMVDVPIIMSFAWRKQALGQVKYFAKQILKYVPGPGWGMQFIDCIFLKRNWSADQTSIQETFANIVQNKIAVWLVMFCEGTRITNSKLAKSQEYARAKGFSPTRHVMIPRTKGFVATVTGLRSQLDAIYDLTIGFPNGVPTLMQLFQGYVLKAHLHVRRFPISSLPQDPQGLAQWLIATYRDKDELMDWFYKETTFPGQVLDEPFFS